MPIEFNPLWKLSNPAWALTIGLLLVTSIATLVYFLIQKAPESSRLRYIRILALTSEIFVSVGIIGLITFSARAIIDSDIRTTENTSQESQRQVNIVVWEFAKQQCLSTYAPIHAIQAEVQTITVACNWWPKLMSNSDEFVDWWAAKDEFLKLSKTKGIRPELSNSYAKIASSVTSLIFAQDQFALNKYKKKLLEADTSWMLIAISTILAAIGIALKWARAALDLRKAS